MNTKIKLKLRELEKEIDKIKGKVVIIRYHNNRKISDDKNPRVVAGELGGIDRDDNHGSFVRLGKIPEDFKYDERIIDYMSKTVERGEKFFILGEEKPENYSEHYSLKTITDFVVFEQKGINVLF